VDERRNDLVHSSLDGLKDGKIRMIMDPCKRSSCKEGGNGTTDLAALV